MRRKAILIISQLILSFIVFQNVVPAVESQNFRLLSLSDSEKLILISQIPNKKKFLLDASSAKITCNGKALEFKELKQYSVIQVQMEIVKKTKNGIALDGIATEININIRESIK
jgi:hypothetical protein